MGADGVGAMPCSYEKSPDYGGPEPTLRGIVLSVLAFVVAAAVVILIAGGYP